jgi:hypothetical protein
LSIVQEPFSVAPCQTLASRFATFSSPYVVRVQDAQPRGVHVERAVLPLALDPRQQRLLQQRLVHHHRPEVHVHLRQRVPARGPRDRQHLFRVSFPAMVSDATPQATRGWAHPPCRHFNNQSCFCLGPAFEVAKQKLEFRSPAAPVRGAERHHPTGRDRVGSPALQTLQDPILLLPWLCFRGGGFPNLHPKGNAPGARGRTQCPPACPQVGPRSWAAAGSPRPPRSASCSSSRREAWARPPPPSPREPPPPRSRCSRGRYNSIGISIGSLQFNGGFNRVLNIQKGRHLSSTSWCSPTRRFCSGMPALAWKLRMGFNPQYCTSITAS